MVFLTLLLLFIWFVGALYKTFKGGAMEFPAFVANLSWPITVFKKTEKSVEKSQAAAHPSTAPDAQISSTSADVTSVTSATSVTSTITAAPISTNTVPSAQT